MGLQLRYLYRLLLLNLFVDFEKRTSFQKKSKCQNLTTIRGRRLRPLVAKSKSNKRRMLAKPPLVKRRNCRPNVPPTERRSLEPGNGSHSLNIRRWRFSKNAFFANLKSNDVEIFV